MTTIRSLTLSIALLAATSTFAAAAPGQAIGAVNLRTGPSTAYPVITTIPAGARVDVRNCAGWCSVRFGGVSGYASASYIATGAYRPAPRVYAPPPGSYRPPPPRSGYYKRPYWDTRYGAWYDGRRWYANGRWYDRPSGFSFGFGFRG